MPHRLPASRTAATSALCLSAACCWATPASARCVNFRADGVPFFTCTRGWAGGFLASEGGQRSVIAPRLEDREDPAFALSRDYKMGVRVGPWIPKTDFHLTLRLDGSGSFKDKLTAEFCAPNPVLVTFLTDGSSRLQSCGDRMIIMDGVEWPSMKTKALEATHRVGSLELNSAR